MERYSEYKDSGIQWIGEIPSHWKKIKVKYISDISKGSGITKLDVFDDGDTPCVRYGEIYTKYNNSFDLCFSSTYRNLINSPRYFEKGDILVSGTGELVEEIGKSIVYVGNKRCLAGGDIILLKHSQNPIFLNYALNTRYVQEQKSYGKAKLKVVHISSSEIGSLNILLPPLSEQERIVKFLEGKVLKIDEYIADKEREIQLLKELKEAEIAKAVTQGLNPNVKMKDSGIPWIGMIPEHWETTKINSVFKERREKVSDKIYPPLSVSKQGITPQLESAVKTDNGDNRKKVNEGDFVVNSRSDRKGSCGISPYTGSVSLINIVLQPRSDIEGKYFHFLFRSNNYIEEYYRIGRGIVADLWTTRYSEMRNIIVPIPPIGEQRAIVEYINNKCSKVDSLITELEAEIEHLKEYKQRLIADCVTGQIKV